MKTVTNIEDLCGEVLSEVGFVMDYVQLGFSGPIITIYSSPIVEMQGNALRLGQIGFRDALCRFIGQTVASVTVDTHDAITIQFEKGRIVLPLDADSRSVGDAVEFRPKAGAPPFDY